MTKICHNDIKKRSNNNHKIKGIPRIFEILLETKPSQLDGKLKGEEDCEDQVHNVQKGSVIFWLIVESHGQKDGVNADGPEDQVLKEWTCDK